MGAGAAFRNPQFSNCLLLTGEMTHHDLLKCKNRNVDVIMLEHSNSKRFYLTQLKELLETDTEMSEYKIYISKEDKDPVEFI
jgi:putative NIF3 family GTP cyclohydrolase 1 type 2